MRPALDGNRIQEVLGIRPGPEVGKAYRYLLEVRLDEGVLDEAEAETRLRAWWAEQG
jgi:poly(A) polymerase